MVLRLQVGEGVSDGEPRCPGGGRFGGDQGPEDDDSDPDRGGESGDPVRQWGGEEQSAEPVAEDGGYRVGPDGSLELLNPQAATVGSGSSDVALSGDSRYLYVKNTLQGTVTTFRSSEMVP